VQPNKNNIFWVVIGNPENRRIKAFSQSLAQWQQSKILVLSYLDLIAQNNIEAYLSSQLDRIVGNIVVRFESPGENRSLERSIINLSGIQEKNSDDYSHGQIVNNSHWFQGYTSLLNKIGDALKVIEKKRGKKIQFMNPMDDILTLFDKQTTNQRLTKANINTPKILPSSCEFTALIENMQVKRCSKVFIKLRYGSSASGVAAFQCSPKRRRYCLTTSVEIEKVKGVSRYFNSLKIRKYTSEPKVVEIINFLLAQDAIVECWIPKATHNNKRFDLRVVTVESEPRFVLVRQSQSTITNLHLGNQRASLDDINLTASQKMRLNKQVTRAANTFCNVTTIGWDVLLTEKNKTPYIIEGNAFGDLLPNLKNDLGSTYDNQIHAWLSKTLLTQSVLNKSSC